MEGVIRDDHSELTIDNSSGFVDQEETSSIDNVEWTNEKHNLYLKSMEASFVAQLYNMKDLFSWSPVSQHGADVNLCRQGSSSGSGSEQFEAWEHCHRPKKNRRTAPQPDVVNGSGKLLENNPRIKCFRARGSPDVAPDNDANESGNIPRFLNEECSDQNFINEDAENRSPRGQRAKRLRNQDASGCNQQ